MKGEVHRRLNTALHRLSLLPRAERTRSPLLMAMSHASLGDLLLSLTATFLSERDERRDTNDGEMRGEVRGDRVTGDISR